MKYLLYIIVIIGLGILYYIFDRSLYYEGENRLDLYASLPFGIEPCSRPDYEGGFALRDKYGFTIAAKGNSYELNNRSVIISEVTAYCFDNKHLIVTAKEINGNEIDILFTQNASPNQASKINASLSADQFSSIPENFKCIQISPNEDAQIKWYAVFRSITLAIQIFIICIFLFQLIKRKAK